MTDDEIVKALKCCKYNNCHECPIKGCTDDIFDEALNLIKRQKAEIEKLQKDFDTMCFVTAKRWVKNAKSEAIKEFAEKVDELLERYSVIHEAAETAMADVIECDNETIEMQSVWDVHTLIANEMGSDYEEMNRLQDNIETIAKERLLKGIEKDFRLLIKEMTEVSE